MNYESLLIIICIPPAVKLVTCPGHGAGSENKRYKILNTPPCSMHIRTYLLMDNFPSRPV